MGHAGKLRKVMVALIVHAIVIFFICADKGSAQSNESSEIKVSTAIELLSSKRFESRQAAFEQLVRGGDTAIVALEHAAPASDAEVAERCVIALVQIARQKDSFSAAVAALERLAVDDSNRFARLAAKAAEELKMTDEERALRALANSRSEMFVHEGKVFGVTVERDREVKWLRHLPTLRNVRLEGPRVTDACIDSLLHVKTEIGLSLSETGISDRGLGRLVGVQNLRSLSLSGELASGTSVGQLVQIKSLRVLSLYRPTELGGELARLKQIESLYLSDLQVTPALIDSLNQLQELESLMMRLDDLSDEQCSYLSNLKKPFHLSGAFNSKHLTLAGWTNIARSPVRFLSVSGSSLSDDALVHVGAITELEHLSISRAPVTDDGLKHLEGLTSLRSLRLTNTEVSEKAVVALREKLPSLINVTARVVGRGRRAFAAQPAFRQFDNRFTDRTDVRMQTGLTAQIAEQLKTVPNVGTVHLITYSATDEHLSHLADVPVRGIRVRSNKITDHGIALLKDHAALESLSIGSKQITDASLDSVLVMPSLRSIEIRDTPLSDEGVRHFIEKLTKQNRITRFRLFDCPDVTQETVSMVSEFNHAMLDLHRQPLPLGLRKIGEPLARPR